MIANEAGKPYWYTFISGDVPGDVAPAPKWMPIVSCLLVIAGLGSLAAFGVGFVINSIVAISVGGGVGFPLLIVGILVALRYRALSSTHVVTFNLEIQTKIQELQNNFVQETSAAIKGYTQYSIKGDNHFDVTKWRAHYGDVDDAPEITEELRNYLNSPCPFAGQANVKVKDTHMLVYVPPKVNNQPLTLNSFAKLTKSANENIPDYMWTGFTGHTRYEDYESRTIEKPYWLLMTREPLPMSRSLAFDRQQELLTHYSYELPQALEATICLTSEYLSSTNLLFYDNRTHGKNTYTRCVESIENKSIVVGGCTHDEGIAIREAQNPNTSIGVAGVRRFFS